MVEVQQVESRIFWCGFGFHEDFCIGTVLGIQKCLICGVFMIRSAAGTLLVLGGVSVGGTSSGWAAPKTHSSHPSNCISIHLSASLRISQRDASGAIG